MEIAELQGTGIVWRVGFDAWRKNGSFAFRTLKQSEVFRRRAAYFRVNASGRVFRVYSRWRTVEVTPRFVQSAA